MSDILTIAGHEVPLGTSKTIDIPLPDLYMHTALSMPVQVIRGKRDGPTVFISAAVHGDEINGIEIIRRLVKSKALSKIKGTLIAIPVVNVYGFINQSRYLPDRRDLNRCFPGSNGGSLAGRLANLFMTEIVEHCTHGIDLHTAAIHRDNLPQIRADLSVDAIHEMAKNFKAPVIVNSDIIEGSLRHACDEKNVPVIVYEAGEALRFNELSIRAGVTGIINVLRSIGMLSKARQRITKKQNTPFIAHASSWVRAPQSGLFRTIVSMGTQVKKGDLLGMVATAYGDDDSEIAVLANHSGIVIGRTNNPLVNEGEALFHIARFSDPTDAADHLEVFQQALDPATDTRPPEELPII